jgi:hypothetical protein
LIINLTQIFDWHTTSSPAAPPNKTGSDRLAFTAFLTLSSHTPSQFHSPGRRFLTKVEPWVDRPCELA